MIRIFLPLICAALGFATASCSQTQGPLTPAAEAPVSRGAAHGAASAAMVNHFPELPPASSERASEGQDDVSAAPSNRDASSDSPASSDPPPPAARSVADTSADAPAAPQVERRASTLIGMPVVSADGNPLGEVKDIIFDRQGGATHLVISYRTEPQGPQALSPGAAGATTSPSYGSDRKLTAIPWDAAMASVKDGQLVLGGATLHGAPSFTPEEWPNLDDPAWSDATDAYWRRAVRAAIAEHPGTPIDPTSRSRARSRGGGG
ncbi:MAG: PRC-barrel domain containing protein [Proteobacteria bacterium]|nr:PRC-barrel domain containing protein [Pseudomonadota bacterium]